MGDFVRVDVTGAVAVIRLDRPPLNILNLAAQDELALAAREVESNPAVRSAVLYGGEKTFAAGADVREMAAMDVEGLLVRTSGLQHGFNDLARLSKPLIAAVTGYGLGGGCELAMCADVRFAARDSVFGQPEIRLGIMPGSGGTQRLARLVGPSKAKDLMMTGRQITAEEACRIGLVDTVFPADEVLDQAMEWAAQFTDGPATALSTIKYAVDAGLDLPLEPALDLERELFAVLFQSQDKEIGMTHFVTKTPGSARFIGK